MMFHEDPAFGEAVRLWLLDNPEILYEMAAKLDAQRAAAAVEDDLALIDANHDALFADPRDGQPGDGEAAFVEFVDYNCGFCKRNHADVKAWKDANPGRAVVIKEFPILGPGSEATAARAVLAIRIFHGMRAYRAIHNAFLEMEGPIEEGGVHALLNELALDDNWDVEESAGRDEFGCGHRAYRGCAPTGRSLGISGTPGFVFRGHIARGLMSLAELEAGADGKAHTMKSNPRNMKSGTVPAVVIIATGRDSP